MVFIPEAYSSRGPIVKARFAGLLCVPQTLAISIRGRYTFYTASGWISTRKRALAFGPTPRRVVGFEEATVIFEQDYYLVRRRDDPEQYLALGWISGKLYSLIIEPRQDDHGEFYHLVTLWPSTSEEQRQYVEEH